MIEFYFPGPYNHGSFAIDFGFWFVEFDRTANSLRFSWFENRFFSLGWNGFHEWNRDAKRIIEDTKKFYPGKVYMKYRKKPTIIEATLWDGSYHPAIKQDVGGNYVITPNQKLYIIPGDYLISDKNGYYPVPREKFLETYEAI